MDTIDSLLDPQFRLRVLDDAKRLGVSAAAEKYGVSRMTIYRWRERLRRRQPGIMWLESLRPGRPGRARMDLSEACWATRWYAVKMPWLTNRSLRQRVAEHLGRPLSESVIRKYLLAIGSKPEDRAFCFEFDEPDADNLITVVRNGIYRRGIKVDWPDEARRRPGGALLDLLLRVSVPRRPPLFVELAADWLTGYTWLATHLQEPYEFRRYTPLNRAVTELKQGGFRPDVVISTWPRYFDDQIGQDYRRMGLRRADDNPWNERKWKAINPTANYVLTPLDAGVPVYPVDLDALHLQIEQRAMMLGENFRSWPSSYDRVIERAINAAPLWPDSASEAGLTPTKFLDMCVAHLDRRWPKSLRKRMHQ